MMAVSEKKYIHAHKNGLVSQNIFLSRLTIKQSNLKRCLDIRNEMDVLGQIKIGRHHAIVVVAEDILVVKGQ